MGQWDGPLVGPAGVDGGDGDVWRPSRETTRVSPHQPTVEDRLAIFIVAGQSAGGGAGGGGEELLTHAVLLEWWGCLCWCGPIAVSCTYYLP